LKWKANKGLGLQFLLNLVEKVTAEIKYLVIVAWQRGNTYEDHH
jgi:hypothetical protein